MPSPRERLKYTTAPSRMSKMRDNVMMLGTVRMSRPMVDPMPLA